MIGAVVCVKDPVRYEVRVGATVEAEVNDCGRESNAISTRSREGGGDAWGFGEGHFVECDPVHNFGRSYRRAQGWFVGGFGGVPPFVVGIKVAGHVCVMAYS